MWLTAKLQAIAKHCIYEMQHCTMLCLPMRLGRQNLKAEGIARPVPEALAERSASSPLPISQSSEEHLTIRSLRRNTFSVHWSSHSARVLQYK
jgi:hypothetical protein